jgi:hypothetical protein
MGCDQIMATTVPQLWGLLAAAAAEFLSLPSYWSPYFLDFQKSSLKMWGVYQLIGGGELHISVSKEFCKFKKFC